MSCGSDVAAMWQQRARAGPRAGHTHLVEDINDGRDGRFRVLVDAVQQGLEPSGVALAVAAVGGRRVGTGMSGGRMGISDGDVGRSDGGCRAATFR